MSARRSPGWRQQWVYAVVIAMGVTGCNPDEGDSTESLTSTGAPTSSGCPPAAEHAALPVLSLSIAQGLQGSPVRTCLEGPGGTWTTDLAPPSITEQEWWPQAVAPDADPPPGCTRETVVLFEVEGSWVRGRGMLCAQDG